MSLDNLPGAEGLARDIKELSEDSHRLAGFEWCLDEDLKELKHARDIKSRLYEIGIDKIYTVRKDKYISKVLKVEECEFIIKKNILEIIYK